MPYEIREFQLLLSSFDKNQNQKFHPFQSQHSFPDIYVFKQQSVHIGVKFRDIEVKKYGFKIKSVEIKIDRQAQEQKHQGVEGNQLIDPHFLFYQNWKKYEVDFKYKLLKPSVFQDIQELERLKNKEIQKAQWKNENPYYEEQLSTKYQSFQSQIQHLNTQLTEKIQRYFNKKDSLKEEIHQTNLIKEWLREENPIKELFVIYKNKDKFHTWQSGKVLVQTFSGKKFEVKNQKGQVHQLKNLMLETFSQEGKNKAFVQSKIDLTLQKQSFKQEKKTLDVEQIYSSSEKQQNLVQKHKKGEKFKQNTSYPQLLQDIYTFL